jgi:hypothetical protein
MLWLWSPLSLCCWKVIYSCLNARGTQVRQIHEVGKCIITIRQYYSQQQVKASAHTWISSHSHYEYTVNRQESNENHYQSELNTHTYTLSLQALNFTFFCTSHTDSLQLKYPFEQFMSLFLGYSLLFPLEGLVCGNVSCWYST